MPNEAALEDVAMRLTRAGVAFRRIVEDAPPYSGQLMAIGVAPGRKEVVGRVLSSLRLLR